MTQFGKMFSAHLKMTMREKQAWFWGIFFPIILMVIFMIIFSGGSDDEFQARIAIVEENPNPTSEMLLAQIENLPVFELKSDAPASLEQAETWIKDNDVDAGIVLPESEDATTLKMMVNKENEKGMMSQAVAGILNEFIQQANLVAAGATPTYELEFEAISAGKDDLKYEDFLLTGMIALSIAQGGLFGMVGLVEKRRKGLLKRLRMTPANMSLFGFADMLMRLIMGIVQIVLLSLIGAFAFGATLHIDVISLIFVFLVGALTFNAMGYMFSAISQTTEAYMGMVNLVSFLMMFLSGVFFPVETMPGWLQPVAQVLPLTYFVDSLRDSMVYATGLLTSTFWLNFGILVLWGVAAFAFGSLFYKRKSIAATR